MAELEPCPFCKGEAVMVRQRKKGRTRDIVNAFARCTFCGARSRNVSTLHVAERNLETYAARAWNARWERTCRNLRSGSDFKCSECGCEVVGSDYFMEANINNGDWNYCPNCQRKVVER